MELLKQLEQHFDSVVIRGGMDGNGYVCWNEGLFVFKVMSEVEAQEFLAGLLVEAD